MSQETFARIFVGFFVSQVGGLSDNTLGCIWDILGEADLKAFSTRGEDFSGEFVAFLRSVLCLSDDEVARAEASTDDFPIAQIHCVAQQVDTEKIAATFGVELQDPPPELITAILECGMLGLEGEDSQFTPEQLACLEGVLGTDAQAQLFSQEGVPSIEAIISMLECGINMLGPEGDSSDGGSGSGLDFSTEELACVVEALDADALAEIIAGERLPTFEEILALVGCDLDLEGLLSGS